MMVGGELHNLATLHGLIMLVSWNMRGDMQKDNPNNLS